MNPAREIVKIAGIKVLRGLINVLNLFPVRRNRLVFYSFNGKKYTCNPSVITEALASDPDLEIWWAFKEPDRFREQLPESVRAVRYRSLKYYYLAKTAKVRVFNVQGFGELAKRKGQMCLQTWHASNGYKKVSDYTGLTRKRVLLGHRDYTHVLSGSASMSERRVRGSMDFHGEIIPGTPRMDVLIRGDDARIPGKVRRALNIPEGCRLALYAPTWRRGEEQYRAPLDFSALTAALERKFGGKFVLAVRLHPNVKGGIGADGAGEDGGFVRDATDYPDMQELLYTADVLISDYSSCIWDYSFTYRPCFLYCYDLDEGGTADSFDIPIETWGFPVCRTESELLGAIASYDEAAFRAAMENHHRQMGSYEDGHATERVCGIIRDFIGQN